VHADLAAETAVRGFHVTSVSYSIQRCEDRGFAASTVLWSGDTGATEWLEFPVDPALPALADYRQRHLDADVLRYVPLRRVTLRLGERSGRVVVVRLKRPSRFREAWKKLRLIEARVAEARASFSVPRPLGLDELRCLFLQEAMPGALLANLLDEHVAPALLGRLGAIHRELHALPTEGLPLRDASGLVQEARGSAAWIAYMLPAMRERVMGLVFALAQAAPLAAPAFCHGHADCAHILVDEDRWSLLHFDDSHAGDPYRDLAMLTASLDYHVPSLRALTEGESESDAKLVEYAAETYLDGYFGGAPRDFVRLAWHRACAEICYLALLLKTDQYHPRAFARRWQRLEGWASTFQSFAA
jgi:hypothetical protein